MARLAEDGGSNKPRRKAPAKKPAARKPAARKKPVVRRHRGQINTRTNRALGNTPKRRTSGAGSSSSADRQVSDRARARQPKRQNVGSSSSADRQIRDRAAARKKAPARKPAARRPAPRNTGRTNNRPVNRNPGGTRRPVVSRPSVGATPGGVIAPTVAKPVAPPDPSFGDWSLNDLTYKNQLSDLTLANSTFNTRQTQDRNAYNTTYNDSLKRLQGEQKEGSHDVSEDYAARGLGQSGVYVHALNDFNNDYVNKQADMTRAKALYGQNLTDEKTDFGVAQGITRRQAYQDALNRYNLKYK